MDVQHGMELGASGSTHYNATAVHKAQKSTATQKPLLRICRNTGKGPFSCIECDKVFKSPQIWKIHILNHSYSSKSYKFEKAQSKSPYLSAEHLQCSGTSIGGSKTTLRRIETKKLQEKNASYCSKRKTYGCNECCKFYRTKQAIEGHINQHTGLRPYKCHELGCDASYIYLGSLWNHTSSVHKAGPQLKHHATSNVIQKQQLKAAKASKDSFSCAECSYVFTSSKELKMHVKLHTGSKPYKCQKEHCGAAFKYAGAFMNHKRFVHGKDIRSKCLQCKVVFKEESSLREHIKITHQSYGDTHESRVSISDANQKVQLEKCVVFGTRPELNNKQQQIKLEQSSLLSHHNQHPQGCDKPGTLEASQWNPTLKNSLTSNCHDFNIAKKSSSQVERNSELENSSEQNKENRPKGAVPQKENCVHPSKNSFTFICELCNRKFEQCIQYIEHVRNHAKAVVGQSDKVSCSSDGAIMKNFYVCGKCSCSFQDLKHLHKHLLVHAAERG